MNANILIKWIITSELNNKIARLLNNSSVVMDAFANFFHKLEVNDGGGGGSRLSHYWETTKHSTLKDFLCVKT